MIATYSWAWAIINRVDETFMSDEATFTDKDRNITCRTFVACIFDTREDARRYLRTNRKDIADQIGEHFKPAIVKLTLQIVK